MILSEMFNKYIQHLRLYNSEGYVSYMNKEAKSILSYFGDIDSSELTVDMLKQYMFDLKEQNLSANTINKHISSIKRIYTFHEIDNHFNKIKKIKEKFVTFGTCEDDPIKIIEKASEFISLQNKIILHILHDTGVRLHELVNIESANVDLKHRTILLTTTKTGNNRVVYISQTTKKLATSFCKKAISRKYLFVNQNGEKIKVNAVESMFARIRKRLGIKNFSPHRLRHSLSTEMYHNGANILLISNILGHSNVNTTRRYVHPDLKKNLQMFDKFHHKK